MSRGFRWIYVAALAVITLTVLSVSYSSYEKVGVRRPLMGELSAHSDVAGASLEREGPVTVVHIELKKVPDLAKTYKDLERVVSKHLGTAPYRIEIEDAGTPALEDAYHSIHFYVEEASMRGTFGEMIRESSPKLEEAGCEYKISVDGEHIYVQIAREGAYLYRIVDQRPQRGGAGA
ncbi:MAG: hypothetical protein ACOX4B_06125 [Bacillota bacterium]|nr:hypothetical protein [Candidatus Fermentithermobacillaceae bacterium]